MRRVFLLFQVALVAAASCKLDATAEGFPCPCPDDTWECIADACYLKSKNDACEKAPPLAITDVHTEFVTPNGAMIAWTFPAVETDPAVGENGLYLVEVESSAGLVASFSGTNARDSVRNDELRVARFEVGETKGKPVERTFVDGLEPGASLTAKLRVVGETCAPVAGTVPLTTTTAFGDDFITGLPGDVGPTKTWTIEDGSHAQLVGPSDCLGDQCIVAHADDFTAGCANGVCPGTIGINVRDDAGLLVGPNVEKGAFLEVAVRVKTGTPFPPVGEGALHITGVDLREWKYAHAVPRTSGETWTFQVPLTSFVPTQGDDGAVAYLKAHALHSLGISFPWPAGSTVFVDRITIRRLAT